MMQNHAMRGAHQISLRLSNFGEGERSGTRVGALCNLGGQCFLEFALVSLQEGLVEVHKRVAHFGAY